MQVWNRSLKRITEEPEVGVGAIRFAYDTTFGRILAKWILCRKPVSLLYGAWQRSFLSRKKVRKFMQTYQISVSDCTVQDFPSFNAFFTRQRLRVDDQTAEGELPAVADSKLTVLPISPAAQFTIKGVPYTVEELLQDAALAEKYNGGWCMIFRLAPDDYHRYSYPDSGTQEPPVRIPGVLHTVNPIAAELGVYRRNTRQYNVLHTERFGDMVQMEVGALLVGKIRNHKEQIASFKKLEEKGYFEYGGSTVILLVQKNRLAVDEDILEHSCKGIESKVRLGEKIGHAL